MAAAPGGASASTECTAEGIDQLIQVPLDFKNVVDCDSCGLLLGVV